MVTPPPQPPGRCVKTNDCWLEKWSLLGFRELSFGTETDGVARNSISMGRRVVVQDVCCRCTLCKAAVGGLLTWPAFTNLSCAGRRRFSCYLTREMWKVAAQHQRGSGAEVNKRDGVTRRDAESVSANPAVIAIVVFAAGWHFRARRDGQLSWDCYFCRVINLRDLWDYISAEISGNHNPRRMKYASSVMRNN